MGKICFVAASPLSLRIFMRDHILRLSEKYEVTAIANFSNEDLFESWLPGVRLVSIPLQRKISLISDFIALMELWFFFRRERFDVVHSLTPKAGLLTMIAAKWGGVPKRIHTFTGQVWSNKKGINKSFLKILDRCIVTCSTSLLADSVSQAHFLVNQNVVSADKIDVLGNGSICGVDTERFKPNLGLRKEIRASLFISDKSIVYLYLGRVNKDKGVQDLAIAFSDAAKSNPNLHLLVVGPDEGGLDAMLETILNEHSSQYHRIGFTNAPEAYLVCADVLCLPSYREGFGSVIIEAAASGVPAIASNIYGLVDAIENGKTGILHEPKNIQEIKLALLRLAENDVLRKDMAKQAIFRAHQLFDKKIVVNEVAEYYQKLLG